MINLVGGNNVVIWSLPEKRFDNKVFIRKGQCSA